MTVSDWLNVAAVALVVGYAIWNEVRWYSCVREEPAEDVAKRAHSILARMRAESVDADRFRGMLGRGPSGPTGAVTGSAMAALKETHAQRVRPPAGNWDPDDDEAVHATLVEFFKKEDTTDAKD